jgi:membrane protease YdiL (CAAX protease family)
MHALSSAARETFTLRWRPGGDTAVALLTAVLMVGLYYANIHAQSPVVSVVFVILGNGILNVLFPAYYVLIVRREGLNQLGITRRWWWLALLLSVVVSGLSWPRLQEVAAQQPDLELPLFVFLLFNGLILWEPFFVYGWLQLRFERAFGIIPAIALAAMCFGAYHIGTYPLSGVVSLVVFGVFFGVLFRVAGGNLLALWPLTWAVTSSFGVLEGGLGGLVAWSDVVVYTLLLIVQVALIALMARQADRPQDETEEH